MVEGKELPLTNLIEGNVPLAKIIETVHSYTTASLLKILATDLQVQRAKVEHACSEDEVARAEEVIAYIRELKQRLGPKVLN
jgi:hypothetical protein